MPKATRHSAVLLGLLGVGLLISSTPSFAEVQNVRVGGDVTVRAFWRKNLDLRGDDGTFDDERFFMTTTGINVGADLTENVSAFVRLANERDWGALASAAAGTAGTTAMGDLDISQAYVTLKELFYSPLTVRIGTQPIVWGRGFVLGSNLIPSVGYGGGDRNGSIVADEFTDFTAFDAVRATLDLSGVGGMGIPLTADYVYIKLNERTESLPDDVNLQGVNFGTHFDGMGAEAEAYYLNKFDRSLSTDDSGSINTWGIRGSVKPVEGAYVYGELAYQDGTRGTDPSGVLGTGGKMSAWGANLGADYTFAQTSMKPKIGAEWIFFSGKDYDGAAAGWDPIARGYFTTALREFEAAPFYPTDDPNDTGSASNQGQFSLYGSLKPLEDLTVAPRVSWFWLDKPAIQSRGGGNTRRSYAGTEVDTQLTYNYTDDVQFGVIYGLFFPGTVYVQGTDNAAQELVTSVSVKF